MCTCVCISSLLKGCVCSCVNVSMSVCSLSLWGGIAWSGERARGQSPPARPCDMMTTSSVRNQTDTHTHAHTYQHTHVRRHAPTHNHASTHTYTHSHTHAYTHTHTHTHTCIHTHAHIQTHTCTHKIFILAFYKYNLNNGIIYVQYNMNDNINLYQDGIPCIWLNIVKIRWKNMK